ncbi:MAG: hypothetical protein A3D31_01095 [Candidatus Fluviicola riflensis]|nr:MAG: hypothetical protein CHH17_04445 [Candidatus Fluviicola riflensis]OGS76202.1 MAG: hypothetical protein A3D31_01095 [Candidatus Fluviicola riflensis]OGS83254.1 MAG: hypothetical protein A2724_00745 [Fluviicola sp. RIFCSPHIGHO2_01_FULL_43_53]OGS83734.1 MAG: hypothetical protein A3E30_17700 [Fluviicola sp. RIFCSPHIGHO2_12_FULL_43_24]
MNFFAKYNRFVLGVFIVFLSYVFSSCAQSVDADQKQDTTTSGQSFRSTKPVEVEQPTTTTHIVKDDASLYFRIEVSSDSLKLILDSNTSFIEISELSNYIKKNDIVNTNKKTCLVRTATGTTENMKAVMKILYDNNIKSIEYKP